ncbi:Protein of unknown function [Ruminococcaceae bacterium YRB3002]|nr:Protein of unknown function [Ruminococcaceae bacterium YRB3002]
MTVIYDRTFEGERPLYGISDSRVEKCLFGEGESPLKECRNIEVAGCTFGWKYPLWYCRDVSVDDTVWQEMARAGVWYSHGVRIKDSVIHAPKNFRRCSALSLSNVKFTKALETLWSCSGVKMRDVVVRDGDYFAMNSSDIEVDGLDLEGNYSFDGCSNVMVRNARLISKDAFWNCRNVTVYDSHIEGEYLGWNSENLTFVNCTIESDQGMCYINNLRMIDCRLTNTTLAFEYSSVDAKIDSDIVSVLNPSSGTITCGRIGELIIEPDRVDPSKTVITATSIGTRKDRPEWLIT